MHRGSAQAPEHPGVEVALDYGVDLAARVGELGVRVHERVLLRVDERVRRAVELVVRQHAQRKRAPDAGVVRGQVAHALTQGQEGAGHALLVHAVRKLLRRAHVVGPAGDAEEEGVGPLVAEEEGEELLFVADDTVGQQRGGALAEEVVRDECGHGRPFARRGSLHYYHSRRDQGRSSA